MVKALVENGVDVHYKDALGANALHQAARKGVSGADKAELIRYLLGRGLHIESENAFKERPLLLAAQGGNTPAFQALMEAGADINARNGGDSHKTTALMAASFDGRLEIIRLLLQRSDLEINAQSAGGETALMYACRGHDDRLDVLEALLQFQGINVNLQDTNNGSTALMNAVIGHVGGGFVQMTERLVQVPGIDLTLRDKNGQTVVEAAENNYKPGGRWDRRYMIPILKGKRKVEPTQKHTAASGQTLSAMEVRVFDQLLQSIDQGIVLDKKMTAWAQANLEGYLREKLRPQIDMMIADYVRMGMVLPENTDDQHEKLFQSMFKLSSAGIQSKLSGAKTR